MANDFLGPRSGLPASPAKNGRTMNAQFEEYEVRPSSPIAVLRIARRMIMHLVSLVISPII